MVGVGVPPPGAVALGVGVLPGTVALGEGEADGEVDGDAETLGDGETAAAETTCGPAAWAAWPAVVAKTAIRLAAVAPNTIAARCAQ